MQPEPTKPRTYSAGAADDQDCLYRRRLLRRNAPRVPLMALSLVESKPVFDQERLPLFDGNQALEAHGRFARRKRNSERFRIERA